MLSNVDIIKELNKNIFIYPLHIKNVKGSSINLVASKNAWSLNTRQSIVDGGYITIPPLDTALIMTEEVLHVSSKIGGLYHSKVTLVSNGMGHIGTTLEPEWYGKSLIAVHNLSKAPYIIKVGDTFVSLTLYYLNRKEENEKPNNFSGRCDILDKLKIDYDPKEIGVDGENQENVEDFKKKCNSEQSKIIKNKLQPDEVPFYKTVPFYLICCIVLLIIVLILALYFSSDAINDYLKDFGMPIVTSIIAVLVGKLISK